MIEVYSIYSVLVDNTICCIKIKSKLKVKRAPVCTTTSYEYAPLLPCMGLIPVTNRRNRQPFYGIVVESRPRDSLRWLSWLFLSLFWKHVLVLPGIPGMNLGWRPFNKLCLYWPIIAPKSASSDVRMLCILWVIVTCKISSNNLEWPDWFFWLRNSISFVCFVDARV